MKLPPKPCVAHAFSLVELLVAIGIFVSLSAVLVSISSQMANLWSVNESQSQLRDKARASLEFLKRELQQVILPLDLQQTTGPYLLIQRRGPDAATPAGGIYFTIPKSITPGVGDTAQVGYWVAGGNLYRGSIDCPDGRPAGPEELIAASPGDASNNYRGLFLQGIWGCWLQAYDSTGVAVSEWDSRSQKALPARVELTLIVMDENLTQRVLAEQVSMPAISDTTEPKTYLEELDANLRRHVAMVSMNVSFDARH